MLHCYRWDPEACNSLPRYMIACYKALYTVTNDIADMVKNEHGVNSINHLKKAVCITLHVFIILFA
jgi:(3S)-linalool synthase